MQRREEEVVPVFPPDVTKKLLQCKTTTASGKLNKSILRKYTFMFLIEIRLNCLKAHLGGGKYLNNRPIRIGGNKFPPIRNRRDVTCVRPYICTSVRFQKGL